MDQWSIVTSLSVLVGLAAAVTGPIVKLNSTIARLSAILEHVLNRLDKLEGEDQRLLKKGEEIQQLLGSRIDSQDRRLNQCENRLSLLEQKKGEFYCSATRFLRNRDRIVEKKSPILRSISEARSLASTAPQQGERPTQEGGLF